MSQKTYLLASLIQMQMHKYDEVEITKAMNILLKDTMLLKFINGSKVDDVDVISNEIFQSKLSTFNEKGLKQKDNGVYYTSNDVSLYITINSILNRYYNQSRMLSYSDGIKKLLKLPQTKLDELIFDLKIIDPTCGGGEFLISSFDIKSNLCKDTSDDNLLKISKTIFGNDIDDFSVTICKIRMFFYICEKLRNVSSYVELARILSKQFYCVDFVSKHNMIKDKFDITVGNPPYVEYSKYPDPTLLTNKFGNIYADVLKNSFDILNEDGIIGYIIPISYTSTPRMKGIREYIKSQTELQFVLSFADRPDCLFSGVHQKLNIVIAKRGLGNKTIYTSNYQYWYKNEREGLFSKIGIVRNDNEHEDYIPKIGNVLERSIYKKICKFNKLNLNSYAKENGCSVFLNMRACFWIKAFTFNPGSKEYKEFFFSEEYRNFVLCLLNSNLFWFFWIVVSDCWHITAKDLNAFGIPNVASIDKYNLLAKQLEERLESTKKYIGTKQTEYEYKHKMCKDIIDQIDEELSTIYGLTSEEVKYIKNFALKYRKGDNRVE